MILVTQQEYDTTLALMRGQVKLPPVFEELQAFMRQKYGLVAVNFVLDKLSHYTPPKATCVCTGRARDLGPLLQRRQL